MSAPEQGLLPPTLALKIARSGNARKSGSCRVGKRNDAAEDNCIANFGEGDNSPQNGLCRDTCNPTRDGPFAARRMRRNHQKTTRRLKVHRWADLPIGVFPDNGGDENRIRGRYGDKGI